MTESQPPKWALRFLRWYCREEYLDEIEGDMVELFHLRSVDSLRLARLFFVWNVIRTFRVQNFKITKMKYQYLSGVSLKQTIRFIRKEKVYSLLSIISLSVGFTLAFFYTWYAADETSFDKFHSQHQNIYRVSFRQYLDQGPYATTSYPIGPAIKKDFPEVEQMTRFGSAGKMTVRYGENGYFEKLNLADQDFFKIFDFELLIGNPATVLDAPNKVVISEELAKKYFQNEDPIGKELKIGSNGSYDSQITGVFKTPPSNSQLQFDILISYSTLENVYSWLSKLWRQMPLNYTYVKLNGNTQKDQFESKIGELKNYVDKLDGGEYDLTITPLVDVHFHEGLNRELDTNKDRKALVTFGLVVLLVLSIGVMNFINITASRYLVRLKEMGMRKILGADRIQLIFQLLYQSFLMVLLSILIAWLLIVLLLPLFNDIAGKNFELPLLLAPISIQTSLGLLITCSLIGGIIPSLNITSIVPSDAFKGSRFIKTFKMSLSRSSLLIFQYAIAVILLIGSIVIFKQLRFLEASVAGDKESRLVVQINTKIGDNYDVLAEELNKHPIINSVSASSHVPSFYGDSWPVRTNKAETPIQTENFVVTENYMETMSYELMEGRMLNKELESDASSSFVVNETFVSMLGFPTAKSAIGEEIYFGSDDPKKGKIVGVAKDFHYRSLKERIGPALFQFSPYDWMGYNFIIVSVNEKNAAQAIALVEEEISKIDANWVVDAEFFDEHFEQLHFQELQQGKLSSIFSIVAIILSCLGQLGLLLNLILSRRKELAIRKVLGASVKNLWYLTTKTYIRVYILGLLISVPIAFYFMKKWLDGFYYHIELDAFPFIVASAIAGTTLISIISIITLRAARANPTESLTDE